MRHYHRDDRRVFPRACPEGLPGNRRAVARLGMRGHDIRPGPLHARGLQIQGVAHARSIARRLGGDIRFDATYTGGARFIMTLPVRS